MSSNTKVINTKIEKNLLYKYEQIKEKIGIQNDAEVIRFLIANFYNESFNDARDSAQKDYEKALPYINKFMEKYGEEWKRLGE